MAACVATILDKKIQEVDIDVASCGTSLKALLDKIENKAKGKIYVFPPEAIVDWVVKSTERYCIVDVCSFVFNDDPYSPSSIRHAVVCEIAEDGKLSLVFNPDPNDDRTALENFHSMGNLFIVKRNI